MCTLCSSHEIGTEMHLLFNQKLDFEKLQTKICKNILGVNKHTPSSTIKAELGVYPLMAKIIKNTFAYWQHVLTADETVYYIIVFLFV